MLVAAELGESDAPEGCVIIADHQTAGRGRLDRRWDAPRGTALLMSILLRPSIPGERSAQVSMAAALGTADALSSLLPDETKIALKWPNDFVANGAKIGGLIAEASWRGSHLDYVVVGIGLNVRQKAAELPEGATSFTELGAVVPRRDELAANVLAGIETRYADLLAGIAIEEDWASCLETLDRQVEATTPSGAIVGTAVGVGADGALLVQLSDGSEVALYAADVVTLRSASGDRPEA